MAIRLFPVTEAFAAEVGDVDLSRALSPEEKEQIRAAFTRYAVLIFPAQQLTAAQHVAFAQLFGPLEPNINTYQDEVKAARIDERISDVSNLDHNNELLPPDSRKRFSGLANRLWHTDSIFRHVPARASLLYARSVAPIGGNTEFADLRAAWDALPEATRRRIEPLVAEHSIFNSRAKIGSTQYSERERASLPGARQVLVRTLPESGRRSLYTASHAGRILGLSEEESTRLLEELMAHATQRQFVYTHRWRVHDLVMWDNRCTMHRAREYDETKVRDMHRTTVSDGVPTVIEQAAA
jgi:alpha-ketoglutarate-dependent 2,4-dichlorophenoxyacetate dioxygenase